LKEQIQWLQRNVATKKVEQKRVRLLLDDWMALDGQTKCDLDAMKVDLETVLVS
jgi:uncharacterized heparinase superfamily protein